MAINFHQKRRKGLFGAPKDMGVQMPSTAPQQPPQAQMGRGFPMEQPQEKPGFFGQGGTGRAIAGNIGDFLLQRSGMQPLYAPQMQQQQAIAAQQAAEQRKRSMDLADYETKQQIQAKYDTQKPTSLQANYDWLRQNHPEAADAYLERMTNNYEYRQGADGRFYRIDIGDQQPQVLGTELPQGWTIQEGGVGNGTGGF